MISVCCSLESHFHRWSAGITLAFFRLFWIVLDSMARINETPDKSWKIEIIITLNNGQPNHIFHTVFGTKTLSQYNQIQSCSAWNGAVLSFKDNLLIFFFFFFGSLQIATSENWGSKNNLCSFSLGRVLRGMNDHTCTEESQTPNFNVILGIFYLHKPTVK